MKSRLKSYFVASLGFLVAAAVGAQWTQVEKESGSGSFGKFGNAVAIQADLALVGDPEGNGGAGAAFVYQRNAFNTWDLIETLTPSGISSGAQFGFSVDLFVTNTECQAIVGANFDGAFEGSAFIYDCSDWDSPQKITASDMMLGDAFGFSVAIAGQWALVGATGNNGGGVSNAGAVYAFQRNGSGTWSEFQKLIANDPEGAASLGFSVGIAGNRAAVGAPQADPGGAASAGAAYVFAFNGSTWIQEAKLVADDADPND